MKFSCTCGQVHGKIKGVSPLSGNHVTCYCTSCQTAANVLGYEASLNPHGGTDIFQTIPGRVHFQAGEQNLGCLKLSPKGILRWHCATCHDPLFTMPDAAWFPVAGLNLARVAQKDKEAFGPITGIHQANSAKNKPPDLRTFGMKRAIVKLIWRALVARLRRDARAPFFDQNGKPSVQPRVLTLEERQAALPD